MPFWLPRNSSFHRPSDSGTYSGLGVARRSLLPLGLALFLSICALDVVAQEEVADEEEVTDEELAEEESEGAEIAEDAEDAEDAEESELEITEDDEELVETFYPLMQFADRPDEDFVIVELRLPSRITLTRDMPGYFADDKLFLPLWLFVELVEFPIDVDIAEGRAQGWFLDESRGFDLDLRRETVIIDGEEIDLEPDEVEYHVDDLYLDMDTLSRWFSMDYEFSYSLLRLDLDPREPIPLQRRLERARRQARVARILVDDGPRYEITPTPYQWATIPVHDIRLDTTLPTSGQIENSGDLQRNVPQSNSYLLRGAGDLLMMSAYWSVSGSEIHPFARARFRMERKDPGGHLLGSMGATSIVVGDIISPTVPLVARTSAGRGVEMSSFPLTRPSAFDRTTMTGPVEPGWEVELYRNNVLIDFQSPSEDDVYLFHEVPLLFGLNELRIVHYGPHGEEREELHIFFIGPGMITPGEGYYRVSLSQHNTEMIPFGGLRRKTDIDGRPRAVVEYEYGVVEQLALAGRLNTLPLRDGGQRFYASLGLRNSFHRSYNSLDLVVGDGLALQAATQTRLWDVNLVADTAFFFADFQSEHFPPQTFRVRNRSSLRLNGVIPTPYTLQVPYSLTFHNDYLGRHGNRTRLSNRLSARLFSVTFVNQLQLSRQPEGDVYMNGLFSVRHRAGQFSPRAELGYSLARGIRLYRLGMDWRISRDVQARADVSHEFIGSHRLTIRGGLNQRLRHFAWGANVGLSHRYGISLGATLTTSIGHNPQDDMWEFSSRNLTSTGTVVPRVFWDRDQDGHFDEEIDEPISEARFIVNNVRRREYETDENGLVVLPDVPSHDYVDVKLERRSLYDPFFIPRPEGHSVVTRPGTTTFLDFPVVMSGEVDGTVWIDIHGMVRPATSLQVQLLDIDGAVVQETMTAFDGFYLLDFIEPGTYRLRVSPEQLARLRLESSPEQMIDIGVEGTIVGGQDFILTRPSE